MTSPTTKDFATLVNEQVTNIQGGSSSLNDLTLGSVLLAIVEAYSAVGLWLQGLILQLLTITRAATSSSTDLDTWMSDFGLERLPADPATGVETFYRATATASAFIPVGSIVQTADATQQYAVVADTTNAAFSATLNGYTMAVGVNSLNVDVEAATVGSAGNVIAGAVNTLGQAIPYVDSVTNAAAFTNGEPVETDTAFRIRFVAYIASLSKATVAAVAYAVTSYQQGLYYSIEENEDYQGNFKPGYFYVVLDDGTGSPNSTLITDLYAAIDAVRPITVSFSVFPPIVLTANVNLSITTAAGYTHSVVAAQVNAAIINAINTLGLGNSLPLTRLAQIAYDTSPAVTNVTGILINGQALDLTATNKNTIKAGIVSVN